MNEQKINVCRALAAMFASSDGEVTDEEMAFVGQAALHLGLDEGELRLVQQALATQLDYNELVATVDEPELRKFLFRRVVAATFTDEHLSETEHQLVNDTASAFGWDIGAVDDYVKWMQEGIDWERRGEEILARFG